MHVSSSSLAGVSAGAELIGICPSIALGSISHSSRLMFSSIAKSSSEKPSSELTPDADENGRNGVHSSATSKTPTGYFTPDNETTTSSFILFRLFIRMHSFPLEASEIFQNETASTRILPKEPAMAAKFASSHASSGIPTTFNHAILPMNPLDLPNTSTSRNHFNQIYLFALKTSAALTELNFKTTCIPPAYLISWILKPSSSISDRKLHKMSKFITSPINTDLSAHLCIS
ncbi:hypothetical protein LXL04_026938 [Taraxacum kok-saghyz]